MDSFIKSVRILLGKSHEWAQQSGHDYSNVYNDNMMYNSISAFFNRQLAESSEKEFQHEYYIPYTLIVIALELLLLLFAIYKIYKNYILKRSYIETQQESV